MDNDICKKCKYGPNRNDCRYPITLGDATTGRFEELLCWGIDMDTGYIRECTLFKKIKITHIITTGGKKYEKREK